MTMQLPPITRFFQQCEPAETMRPDDPRWVDFDDVRGEFLTATRKEIIAWTKLIKNLVDNAKQKS